MSPTTTAPARPTTGTAASGSTWEAWLAVLEEAIADYDRQLLAQDAGAPPPVFTPVPMPSDAGSVAPALLARMRTALEGLEQLTHRTIVRRDAVVAQLAALPRPRARAAGERDQDLGRAFDVSG